MSIIIDALRAALAERGLAEAMVLPWYFPSVSQDAGLLERNGFRVAMMQHFAQPTELVDCPNGVADWTAMFGSTMLEHVDPAVRPEILERVNELTRARLHRQGRWYADYVRLRFLAVAESWN